MGLVSYREVFYFCVKPGGAEFFRYLAAREGHLMGLALSERILYARNMVLVSLTIIAIVGTIFPLFKDFIIFYNFSLIAANLGLYLAIRGCKEFCQSVKMVLDLVNSTHRSTMTTLLEPYLKGMAIPVGGIVPPLFLRS